MIVVDCSALVHALAHLGDAGRDARSRLTDDPHWIAPDILTLEVVSSLRGQALGRKLTEETALSALAEFRAMDISTYPTRPLIGRIWELRDNLSVYDAAYVALAEAEDCALVTRDARIAKAPGTRCRIEVLGA
ncbi:type II toxin-antitoxin system VapC family toxin [Actinomyces timonensis]|jgi:pilT domain-containing protein|uniref:type II toxin-antitoxin system VapC family toxin n=1 Tax=Actinomyces timonensis TaxID=1288391 RepID=UPI0004753A59|nr:type II toxin-antitoxin system VapC family toxin [Actinomyces timonensis]